MQIERSVSMETDAQAYTGPPPTKETEPPLGIEPGEVGAAAKVASYRAALSSAARSGKLDDAHGAAIAAKFLGLTSGSPSAAALVSFERALHGARTSAMAWSSNKSDRSSQVMALESLADDAAERLQIDLACLTQ